MNVLNCWNNSNKLSYCTLYIKKFNIGNRNKSISYYIKFYYYLRSFKI